MINNDITFYAFRYALGRQTYAVNDVVNYLLEHWGELDKTVQKIILKEISQHLHYAKNQSSDINILWQRVLKKESVEDAGTKDFGL